MRIWICTSATAIYSTLNPKLGVFCSRLGKGIVFDTRGGYCYVKDNAEDFGSGGGKGSRFANVSVLSRGLSSRLQFRRKA